MESTVMETAISLRGIWAVLAVFFLIYIVKSMNKGMQSRKKGKKITRQ